MKIKRLLFLPLTLFLLISCGTSTPDSGSQGGDGGGGQTINYSLTFNQNSVSLEEGDTYSIRYTTSPKDAEVTFKSQNTNVATVNSAGLVTAVKEGTTTIKLSLVADTSKTATFTVTVSKKQTINYSLSFSEHEADLKVGGSYQINYSVSPKGTKVVFGSYNNKVATVDSSGYVRAVGVGSTVIIAQVENDTDVSDTITVRVTKDDEEPPVVSYSLSVNPTSTSLVEGDTYLIRYTASPLDAEVKFSSQNNSVATVDEDGLVTAVKEGTTTISLSLVADTSKTATFTVTVSKKSSGGDDEPVVTTSGLQDKMILHCFNWSMSNITSRLSEIKKAGYSVIQLSPMQPQKDPYSGNWKGQWWKLYQPLGFNVATSGQNTLGTKQELKTMCEKAEEQGIKVIVDIVSNHLAGGNETTLNGSVRNFEQEIYDQELIHKLGKYADDGDSQSIVQGNIGGFPDLKTESSVVQNRVLSLLKEYLDCGIDGFRFDAAKHIETPSDGEYASNFWPTILNGATSYAKSKNLDEPYYYGEILNKAGNNRSFSYYTDMMSTLDSNQGKDVLDGVVQGNISKIKERYNSTVSPDKLVLWAESHDTYSNDNRETTDISISNINKAYVIQGSRKDASVLYLARPGDNTNLGDVGTTNYKDAEVVGINKFHKMFVGYSESIVSNNNCFVNVRGSKGAVIVALNNSSSASVKVEGLPDGTYIDLITDKSFTVSNQMVNVTFTNGACILVSDSMSGDTSEPTITVGNYNEVYSSSQTISVTTKNATSVTYTINGGSQTTLSNNQIVLSSSLPNGAVDIKITAKNASETTNKTISLVKTDTLLNKEVLVTGLDSNYSYAAWVWKDGDGAWVNVTIDGNVLGFDMNNKTKFIIVKFNKGASIDWSNKVAQSEDVNFSKRIYSFAEIGL